MHIVNPIARGSDDGWGSSPADCLFNLKIQTSNDEASRTIDGGKSSKNWLRTRLRIAHDPGPFDCTRAGSVAGAVCISCDQIPKRMRVVPRSDIDRIARLNDSAKERPARIASDSVENRRDVLERACSLASRASVLGCSVNRVEVPDMRRIGVGRSGRDYAAGKDRMSVLQEMRRFGRKRYSRDRLGPVIRVRLMLNTQAEQEGAQSRLGRTSGSSPGSKNRLRWSR